MCVYVYIYTQSAMQLSVWALECFEPGTDSPSTAGKKITGSY